MQYNNYTISPVQAALCEYTISNFQKTYSGVYFVGIDSQNIASP